MTRVVQLSTGGVTLVDDQDYQLANEYRWHRNRQGYARTSIWNNGRSVTVLLHRLIMQTAKGFDTDHINGDRLDNRRANLRVCTRSQNMANQYAIRGRSRYRGVCFHRNRWQVDITVGGRKVFIGCFTDEQEAARAYNAKATELYGAFAHLNVV